MDMTLVKIAQMNSANTKKEIKKAKKNTKAKQIVICVCAIVLIATFAGFIGTMDLQAANHTEQKYIVRYGTTFKDGSIIKTEDGNIWKLKDAPEFQNGKQVRVLFDSNNTSHPNDDIIIDITERQNFPLDKTNACSYNLN